MVVKFGNIYELFPQTTNNAKFANAFCGDQSITQPVCVNFIYSLVGTDPDQLNSVRIYLYYK